MALPTRRPAASTRTEPAPILGICFLNARPLLAGLEAGIDAPFAYTFATAEPATCARLLADGHGAAALVPVAALPEIAGAVAWPSLGVASRGEVTSVLLISRVPPERIATLAVHAASRTSVVLAQLLLRERWGAVPAIRRAQLPLQMMLREADAAVVIGDPALAVRRTTGLEEIDLGAAWREWTGTPFVFAVWAMRDDAPPACAALLEASFAYAQRHWEALLPGWAEAHRRPVAEVRSYLERVLTYRLTHDERSGLEEFLRRARAAGLLPGAGVPWAGPAVAAG